MEPRLTRGQKRKQEASATAANASTEGAGPSSRPKPCTRSTRSRTAADEATAKALKAPAVTARSTKAAQAAALPSKRPAEKPITRARSKRQTTSKKQADAPDVKQEKDLPDAPALPLPAAQQEAGPSNQEPGPSAPAGLGTRMEEDRKKSADQKRSDAAAAAQREADEQVQDLLSRIKADAACMMVSRCSPCRRGSALISDQ